MRTAIKTPKLLWRVVSATVFVALAVGPSGAWQEADAAQGSFGPIVVESIQNDISPALRDIEPIPPVPTGIREMPLRPLPGRDTATTSQSVAPDQVLQQAPSRGAMPTPVVNFEGVNNLNGVLPPDTNGDVGPNHYVQWVNLSFAIYSKTGTTLYGPANGNTLWSGFGGPCETSNDGDPIALYDSLADRWLMSQFAVPNPFYQCVAVSTTSDPTGTWYRYAFLWPGSKMNDYPKFGVWPDGYYMTVNQFTSLGFWAGAGVAVLDRSSMLAGDPATMIYFDIGAVDMSLGGMLPSDLDGPPPTAGTPNYFSEWDDSLWLGDPSDTLRIWEFDVDWTTPANSTFGADSVFTPNEMVTTADVDPNMCGYSRDCIPQPSTTRGLDAISDRLMYRLQYRDYGSYSTLVSNHTVDADGTDHAGIHWFVLRDSGSGWVMDQQGVYAPDSDHRWMGSAALDASGNLALGYSVSSSTTYPSIRYAGRLVTDPAGTLPQSEATLRAGGGSQTHIASRWGDYSMMALDPADDCTFWYTQEYMASTGSAPWRTRIGSFKLPCIPTTTTITSDSPDPSTVGQAIVVNFSVTAASGTPTGNVTVSDGVDSCMGTVAAGTCNLTLTTAGARMLTATYAGDADFIGSSDTEPHQVNQASTTTNITSDAPDPSFAGLPVVVNFSVTSTGGTPTGNVTVSDGVDSCMGTVATGTCSLTLTTLGARTLTATYAGDASFIGSSDTEPHQVKGPTFADVPFSHWAWPYVEAIYSSGLTIGCGASPLIYCPDGLVTRAEMAVFLKKGIHGSSYTPPAPNGSSPFSDLAGHWAEAWMEELYDEGLTVGYPDGTYRPENQVTRGEMAVFLLKAKHGSSYVAPAPAGGSFSDVAGHWAEAWIEQLSEEGITSGYPDGTFRPENNVTRAEMAVFLVRAFSLPLP